MKRLLFIFILLIPILSVKGQERKPCLLGAESAPTIRDLKLGMSPESVEKILGIKIELKEDLINSYYTNPAKSEIAATEPIKIDVGSKIFLYTPTNKNPIPTSLIGISGLSLRFYENALYVIYVIYNEPDFKWNGNKDFIRTISEKFGLPTNAWFNDSYLKCSGFTLYVKVPDNKAELRLGNREIEELLKEREEQAIAKEEQKIKNKSSEQRRIFKP